MNTVCLLVDLQNDFLFSSLYPTASILIANIEKLLEKCRQSSIPIIHARISVDSANDTKIMPHWQRNHTKKCIIGTWGHEFSETIKPVEGEVIVDKTFFSAFANTQLEAILQKMDCKKILIAGIHFHSCVQATIKDAYEKGFEVITFDDAIASYDPILLENAKDYLKNRMCEITSIDHFFSSQQNTFPGTPVLKNNHSKNMMVHFEPHNNQPLWQCAIANKEEINTTIQKVSKAQKIWSQTNPSERTNLFIRLAELLQTEKDNLAKEISQQVGKPILQSIAEVERSISLIHCICQYTDDLQNTPTAANAHLRYQPVGTIALITPWNNPLAIPIGKIIPALFYGNTVVWKPAPAATTIAYQIYDYWQKIGGNSEIDILAGDSSTARLLMKHEQIDAVTVSGSISLGYTAQAICSRRLCPLQAELGGNNAAIICKDADISKIALLVAKGAFEFAGQRCTANRRVIIEDIIYEDFMECLFDEVKKLHWGSPYDEATDIGPVVSKENYHRIQKIISRANQKHKVIVAHTNHFTTGNYIPPTIVCCDDPKDDIVQQETFGPVLVVQKFTIWEEAIPLLNNVPQGLVAALFSNDKQQQQQFLQQAKAGILKINQSTVGADANSPFGGWKLSGIGPPEHGKSNREFYTKTQTIYYS